MENFIWILFCLFLALTALVIRLYLRFKKDRRIIYTELLDNRHQLNTMAYDFSMRIHNDLEEKRKSRTLTDDERKSWESSREVLRLYHIEAEKYYKIRGR